MNGERVAKVGHFFLSFDIAPFVVFFFGESVEPHFPSRQKQFGICSDGFVRNEQARNTLA